MSEARPAIFDAFNARFLEPERVGSTFVLSPFLGAIVGAVNTAILGPRGSGKTTLLKMLTLPGLLGWRDPRKASIAASLEYLSVYIPANLTWSAEYRTFSVGHLDNEAEQIISISLFRHNVLLSLVTTWQDAADLRLQNDPELNRFWLPIDTEHEPEYCRDIAEAWNIDLRISSLSGLREAIGARVRVLQKISVRTAIERRTASDIIASHPFLGAHFLDDVTAFWEFLKRRYEFDAKIALCFDEVEIAAASIANAILRAPRSIDQRFLIKFSAAPYVGVAAGAREPTSPTQREDFQLVFLSSFASGQTRGFSEALFNSLCEKHEVPPNSDQILGRSFLDDASGVPTVGIRSAESRVYSRYASSGSYQRKFESLHSIDPSFREYLSRKHVDVRDLSVGTEEQRAADVRKILWPVLVREEFLFDQDRREGQPRTKRRLRAKNAISDIYTGAGSLFAICEGNPRWLLGLLDPMVAAFATTEEPSAARSVRRSFQRDLVERMISAYFALLSTIPSKNSTYTIHSLVDLVDRIGIYFQRSVLGPDFNADPVLSFKVDAKVTPEIRELIGKGINIGAFVTTPEVPGDQGYRVGDITGLKVRLSNIFAPHFKLPLAGGRTIGLSTVLRRGSNPVPIPTLSDLFGEKI